MPKFLRRWRGQHLIGTWVVYWAGLALVTLWQPISIARRLSQLPDGQGTISAEVRNATFSAQMLEGGSTLWSVSTSVLALALWIAGPPLMAWVVWAISRSRPDTAMASDPSLGVARGSEAPRPGLPDGIAFADHLTARRPSKEGVGIPRDHEAP